MEVVRGVPEFGANRHRPFTVANPPIGSDDCREGRDRGHRVVQRVLLAAEAQKRRGHSQGIHGRRLCRRGFAKHLNGRARERSPCGQVLREPNALGRFRQAAVQEQVRHLLETGARSQIFHGVSGDRQPARLAIDVAEPGRRGHDIFQSLSHVFDVWVRLLDLSILIGQST